MIWWRPVAEENFGLLSVWLAQPHVARWWPHDTSDEGIARDFGPAARGAEPSEDLLVMRDGIPIGLVRRRRLADHPRHAAELEGHVDVPDGAVTLDYLIGDPAHIGQGLGPLVIREIVAQTWTAHRDAPAVVVPVPTANRAAWRALEKAGLHRVGSTGPALDGPASYIYRVDQPREAQGTPGESTVNHAASAAGGGEDDDSAGGHHRPAHRWQAVVFWAALPLALLWWGWAAWTTDGYDGESCGEVGDFADRCAGALGYGETWGGRYLLFAAILGVVLLVLPRGGGFAAAARKPVFALATVCLLASVVTNANAMRYHSKGNELNNPALRAPHSTVAGPPGP
ncbi:acetyltransferase [Streptomyces alboflavus]|uniref:Acetyltransferase n=1 Tax=Streptomyces alboflavus TaxID=67267 RepID=A0A1Z1WI66_9ACTN|nr:GNAT family N-acetyltransferase [Streptomyces alboflavus]ARX86137.1 acetyltransferase [Streptomyces alboflavus]